MSSDRPSRVRRRGPLFWALGLAALLGWLWLSFRAHTLGGPWWALGLLVLGAAGFGVYLFGRSQAWRYLFPGVAGMLLFVAFPLAYTVQLGFTNYASAHLLSEDGARAYLLAQAEVDEASVHRFTVHPEDQGWRLWLRPAQGHAPALVSPVLALAEPEAVAQPVPLAAMPPPTAAELTLAERLRLRPALQGLSLRTPEGATLRYAGVREFAQVRPLWQALPDGSLQRHADGTVFRPHPDTGYFERSPATAGSAGPSPTAGSAGASATAGSAGALDTTGAAAAHASERLVPGFKAHIGWDNHRRMLFDPDFRGPLLSIFGWTVTFAALTVLFSTALGLGLAVLLNWEALSHRTLYRTLLFLPYAVPGFISILVWKGLFNQNFGEINALLNALFGIRPQWFADPLLAKVMLLVVNTWLGYPYIMVLATGLLKAIPADLYEASAIAGAGPWANFRRITAPLLLKPLAPLLISAFAFNFNNFVLISLLTDGRPDHLNTKLPAGTNDILVSYTYRIAFTDAGQNFGLAAAISTLIFVLVALMALLQLRLMKQVQRA